MSPPPPRHPAPARDQVAPTGAPPVPTPLVRITVNAQDLEKIPDTFRGMVYEIASYTVEHYYKAKPKDLWEIEASVDSENSSTKLSWNKLSSKDSQ